MEITRKLPVLIRPGGSHSHRRAPRDRSLLDGNARQGVRDAVSKK